MENQNEILINKIIEKTSTETIEFVKSLMCEQAHVDHLLKGLFTEDIASDYVRALSHKNWQEYNVLYTIKMAKRLLVGKRGKFLEQDFSIAVDFIGTAVTVLYETTPNHRLFQDFSVDQIKSLIPFGLVYTIGAGLDLENVLIPSVNNLIPAVDTIIFDKLIESMIDNLKVKSFKELDNMRYNPNRELYFRLFDGGFDDIPLIYPYHIPVKMMRQTLQKYRNEISILILKNTINEGTLMDTIENYVDKITDIFKQYPQEKILMMDQDVFIDLLPIGLLSGIFKDEII